jgi:outer membrane protein TolC
VSALLGLLVAVLAVPRGAVTAADSARPLTFEDFYRVVATHHPVVQQARLLDQIADGEVRQARGAFDPTMVAGWDRKTFGGTRYYDYLDASITIPTPLGADIKIGYERADGRYINPDRRTPSGGLLSAGISVPIGQRLITDERRNALAQARALRDYAQGERAALVNKFLLTAAKLYGEWYEAYRRQALAHEAVALADFRLRAVRSRVVQGDAAAIDTIEAQLELQRRSVQRLEAAVDFRNASIVIEGLLWDREGRPVDLSPGAIPSMEGLEPRPVDSTHVMGWLAVAEQRHPSVRKAVAKVRQSESEQLFALQQRWIPAAELSYAPIGDRSLGAGALQDAVGTSTDAKLGGTFKLPLLALKERGKYSAVLGKLEQQRLELALTRRDIRIAVQTAANDLAALDSLLQLQRQAILQSRLLRDGEQRKFENGESTLFLVNTRERAVIEEEVKRIALEAKYANARAALAVAIGEPARLPER